MLVLVLVARGDSERGAGGVVPVVLEEEVHTLLLVGDGLAELGERLLGLGGRELLLAAETVVERAAIVTICG